MTLYVYERAGSHPGDVQVPNGMPSTANTSTFTTAGQGWVLLRILAVGTDHTITWPNNVVERFPAGTDIFLSAPAGTLLTFG